ncbi:MAG: hypothetical protein RO469_16475 [Thermincola sp.]|nr:hypothetical protein [Thermincola sp.]MDT3702521.1 hypothetical protein [Thermincola sp.]
MRTCKKVLVISLALLIILSVVGCSKSTEKKQIVMVNHQIKHHTS